jgi:hypothetical protein
MIKSCIHILCYLMPALPMMVYAQQNEVPVRVAVKVLANPVDNRITLRWAPTTPPSWEYGNNYGYSVQRVTITRNNQPLTSKAKIILSSFIAPKPLAEWEREVKQNKYAAVAAQALYGKKFEVSQQGGVAGMVNQAKESEQRFSFALFSADYSPVVAVMSGLSFTDTHVNQEENYLYKVWVNMPDNRYPIDTGYVYTGLKEARALPALPKPEVKFMDKQAVISWNYGYYVNTYIAYFVERSADGGKNFNSISKDPIVPAENTSTPTGIVNIIDTLQDNTITYSYRIKGVSVFGESGPYSTTAGGHGKKSLSAAPAIRNLTVIDNERVKFQWEYPPTMITEVSGFQIERSFKPKGPFEIISPVLKANVQEFMDTKPRSSNYYRVVALGEDDKTYSFPHLAQLTDSIPPAVPQGISAVVDTLGVVTLKWERGKEDDLLGYRVFRANFDSHEYGQVTTSPVQEPLFIDTINLKTLTKNIYYKVVAVDRHFNPSKFSDAVVVERPDIIPPSTPSFCNIQYRSGEGVVLQWIRSSSEDVSKHVLYKRSSFDNSWKIVATTSDSTSRFVDTEVPNKNTYEYVLVAQDRSGLVSKPSSPIRIAVNDRSNKPSIDKFAARADEQNKEVVLSWSYDAPEVQQFWIYRKDAEGRMRLLESVPPEVKQFNDKLLTVNTQYEYSIKAVFRDGAHSPLSKLVKVLY